MVFSSTEKRGRLAGLINLSDVVGLIGVLIFLRLTISTANSYQEQYDVFVI